VDSHKEADMTMTNEELYQAIKIRVDDAVNDRDFSGIKLAELFNELDISLSDAGMLPEAWVNAYPHNESQQW
jgi:hypothetical protein